MWRRSWNMARNSWYWATRTPSPTRRSFRSYAMTRSGWASPRRPTSPSPARGPPNKSTACAVGTPTWTSKSATRTSSSAAATPTTRRSARIMTTMTPSRYRRSRTFPGTIGASWVCPSASWTNTIPDNSTSSAARKARAAAFPMAYETRRRRPPSRPSTGARSTNACSSANDPPRPLIPSPSRRVPFGRPLAWR